MGIIEKITLSLDNNQLLTDEVKINFLELITIFNKQFPEVELDNFAEKLETLKIEKGNKYLVKDPLKYDIKNNTLYINPEELAQLDAKHELMIIVLQMITAKEDYYGFNKNNEFEALSIGLTESIANLLVGQESDDDE